MASEFVEYAKTFIGVRYVWGSVNPSVGLDCFGFVNAVAKHYDITVPRTSVSFTNLGTPVTVEEAKPGDIILFTGTDLRKRIVGHMGIVTGNENGELQFIHSSSGKKNGVNISGLTNYYKSRLVKIIRILPLQEDRVVS
ncbi:MAG: NlpC/P60 family protein [Chitinophagaceae bacterium]